MPTRSLLAALAPLLVIAAAASAPAASEPDPKAAVRLLSELAAIPSNSSNAEGVGRAADWLVAAFNSHGLVARRLDTLKGNPLVYAEHDPGQATRTVLFYMHY